MRKKLLALLGIISIVVLLMILSNQNLFPDIVAKKYGGTDVIESEIIQNENYRIYLYLTREQLISCNFKKELLWRNTLINYKDRDDVITLGNYENNWDDYAIVYGCCNDSTISFVEFIMKDEAVHLISTIDKNIFWLNVRWEDIIEINALDVNKKLIYQVVDGDLTMK